MEDVVDLIDDLKGEWLQQQQGERLPHLHRPLGALRRRAPLLPANGLARAHVSSQSGLLRKDRGSALRGRAGDHHHVRPRHDRGKPGALAAGGHSRRRDHPRGGGRERGAAMRLRDRESGAGRGGLPSVSSRRREPAPGSSAASRLCRTPGWPRRTPACSRASRRWVRRSRGTGSGRSVPRRGPGRARRRRPRRVFRWRAGGRERRP